MEVRGPNFGGYDSRHIQHVQGEIARSVKPNVLRQLEQQDLDEETFQRLLAEDLVDLSPEAKQLLQSLRRERRKGTRKKRRDAVQKDFASLLDGLEQLRRQVEEDNIREGLVDNPQERRPFVPPQIQLSAHNPDQPRPRRRAAAEGTAVDLVLGEAGRLARKMVYYAPSSQARETVAHELEVFGVQAINLVKRFGVNIIVLERNKALTDIRINGMYVVAPSERTFDGRPWSQVRGLYDPSRRLLVVGEELLGLRHRSTARHEFAHAYDHTFSEKNHRKLPLSVQLWNSFRGSRSGMVSDYAGTNPAEYFAESVEAFFQEGARDRLRSSDPQMFDYLRGLFAA